MIPEQITTVHLTSKFKKSFKRLPAQIQQKTIDKDKLFRANPFDARLNTHKLTGELTGYYSYSVDYYYRILFRFVNQNTVIYFNIGTHEIYKK